MYETFVKMQRVVEKQILAVEELTVMEGESSLFFQQLGYYSIHLMLDFKNQFQQFMKNWLDLEYNIMNLPKAINRVF